MEKLFKSFHFSLQELINIANSKDKQDDCFFSYLGISPPDDQVNSVTFKVNDFEIATYDVNAFFIGKSSEKLDIVDFELCYCNEGLLTIIADVTCLFDCKIDVFLLNTSHKYSVVITVL